MWNETAARRTGRNDTGWIGTGRLDQSGRSSGSNGSRSLLIVAYEALKRQVGAIFDAEYGVRLTLTPEPKYEPLFLQGTSNAGAKDSSVDVTTNSAIYALKGTG